LETEQLEGSIVLEDEMKLDGAITSLYFDALLVMGVVRCALCSIRIFSRSKAATASGSIWYINWEERSSIKIVGGHSSEVWRAFYLVTAQHEQILDMKIEPKGAFAITGGADGSLRVWSIQNMEQIMAFQLPPKSAATLTSCVGISPGMRVCSWNIVSDRMQTRSAVLADTMTVLSGFSI
jgi:WD40 repeat protein